MRKSCEIGREDLKRLMMMVVMMIRIETGRR